MTNFVAAYTPGLGLALAALVAWIFVWLIAAVRVLRSHDLGVGGKILWLVVILVLPILGLLVYFLWDAARPRSA
ncbi:MAG: PLDc N-terminal domain-containing protein [Actinomycetota bacterium]